MGVNWPRRDLFKELLGLLGLGGVWRSAQAKSEAAPPAKLSYSHDHLGCTTTLTYDGGTGRPLDLSRGESYTYDGTFEWDRNPMGQRTTIVYDARGRLR